MGQELLQESFQPSDYSRFSARLDDCMTALAQWLGRPDFDPQPPTIGAELELSLMRADGSPAGINLALLEALNDARFTPEINRFNIEFNSTPRPLAGCPFASLGQQFEGALAQLRDCAAKHDALPIMIGTLPTLSQADLGLEAMTPTARYRALNALLVAHRGRPFQLEINGEDPLTLEENCITFEGANTSLQIHLKVAPANFVRYYNAAQMAVGPALAACGNSPFFLQHRLWEETRIVVFKQTVDDRDPRASRRHATARVGIGGGWWEGDVATCLARHLRAHAVLLPILSDEDPTEATRQQRAPGLAELRTHNGTIWHWNRPVYDPAGGGHLRIEFRALPSGPTIADMMANAALMLGLTLALAEHGPDCADFPFAKAEFNLYRGAQSGLAAQLLWPTGEGGIQPISARDWLLQWLPQARQALILAGIDEAEADTHLDIIRARVESGRTGARWQHDFLTQAPVELDRNAVLHRMAQRYQALSAAGAPVHTWPNQ